MCRTVIDLTEAQTRVRSRLTLTVISSPTKLPENQQAMAAALIEELESESFVGLTAPAEAVEWSLEAIQEYFDTDVLPPPSTALICCASPSPCADVMPAPHTPLRPTHRPTYPR